MRKNTDTKINSLANIIVQRVSSVDQVSFTRMSENSLCYQVAKQWRVACNVRLRNQLREFWNHGPLKSKVESLLSNTSPHTELSVHSENTPQILGNATPKDDLAVELRKIAIVGDGNCLFRSLSYALHGCQDFHHDIRKRIVGYVLDHWEANVDILVATCEEMHYSSRQHYESIMGSNSTFGTDFEIGIFCRIFGKHVKIYRLENNEYDCVGTVSVEHVDETTENYINILFSGNRRNGHYDFLQTSTPKDLVTHENNSKEQSPPKIEESPRRAQNEVDLEADSNSEKQSPPKIVREVGLQSQNFTVDIFNGECTDDPDSFNSGCDSNSCEQNFNSVDSGHKKRKCPQAQIEIKLREKKLSQSDERVFGGEHRSDDDDKNPNDCNVVEHRVERKEGGMSSEEYYIAYSPPRIPSTNVFQSAAGANDFDLVKESPRRTQNEVGLEADSYSEKPSPPKIVREVGLQSRNFTVDIFDGECADDPESFNSGCDSNSCGENFNSVDSGDEKKKCSGAQIEIELREEKLSQSDDKNVLSGEHRSDNYYEDTNDCNVVERRVEREENVVPSEEYYTEYSPPGLSSTRTFQCAGGENKFDLAEKIPDKTLGKVGSETDVLNFEYFQEDCDANPVEYNYSENNLEGKEVSLSEFNSHAKLVGKIEKSDSDDVNFNTKNSGRRKRKSVSYAEDKNSDNESSTHSMTAQSFDDGDHHYDSDTDSFYIKTFSGNLDNQESDEPHALNSTPSSCENKKNKKPSYERPEYKFLIGKVRIITERIATKFGCIDNELLRDHIDALSTGTFKCSCPLRFYGGIRDNEGGAYVLYAQCSIVGHKARFRYDVFEIDENIIEINFSSTHVVPFKHDEDDVKPFRQIRGRKRTGMKKLLRYCSARKIQLDAINDCDTELLADGHTQKVVNLGTLHTVVSEDRADSRVQLKSRDLSDLTQLFMDEHLLRDPFVRQVALPLQVIMYTEKQLGVIDRTRPVVIHVDASGANARTPQFLHSKKIFYYCVVYRGIHSTVALAEELTSEHDQTSKCVFFDKLKAFFTTTWNVWPFCQGVVVDWSWVFINSILRSWNNMRIEAYLQECFNYAERGVIMVGKVIILSCCAHIMHRVAKTIKILGLTKIKRFLMECMALLILSRNLVDMAKIFQDIAFIVLSKNNSIEVKTRILNLTGVKGKRESEMKDLITETDELEQQGLRADNDFYEMYGHSKAIYATSPFFEYFWKRLEFTKDLIKKKEICVDEVTNDFYAPAFAAYLMKTFMPYCPLWSAIMMELVDPKISRVTNAYVESHVKNYKTIVLDNKKNWTVAEVCRKLKSHNERLVKENGLDIMTKGKLKMYYYPLYIEKASDPHLKEKWGRTKKEILSQKTKRPRNVHMEERELIRLSKKIESQISDALLIGKDAKITKCSQENRCNVAKSPVVSVARENLQMLPNGLIDSLFFYMGSRSRLIMVGLYSAAVNHPLVFREFLITPRDIHTVAITNAWIDGQIIDAFTTTHIDKWENVSYVPTDIGGHIFGTNWNRRKPSSHTMYNITTDFNDILLIPYAFEGHWRLLMMNIKDESLTLLDPFETSYDIDRMREALGKYLKACNSQSTFSQLKHVTWNMRYIKSRPYQAIGDGSSCGVYVMYYMNCLGTKSEFDTTFDPKIYREEVAERLLHNSKDVRENCIYCARSLSDETRTQCTSCGRLIHEICIIREDMNTSDEEGEDITGCKSKKKKKKVERVEFLCRLCRRFKKVKSS